jgi:hypothetical protein
MILQEIYEANVERWVPGSWAAASSNKTA